MLFVKGQVLCTLLMCLAIATVIFVPDKTKVAITRGNPISLVTFMYLNDWDKQFPPVPSTDQFRNARPALTGSPTQTKSGNPVTKMAVNFNSHLI